MEVAIDSTRAHARLVSGPHEHLGPLLAAKDREIAELKAMLVEAGTREKRRESASVALIRVALRMRKTVELANMRDEILAFDEAIEDCSLAGLNA